MRGKPCISSHFPTCLINSINMRTHVKSSVYALEPILVLLPTKPQLNQAKAVRSYPVINQKFCFTIFTGHQEYFPVVTHFCFNFAHVLLNLFNELGKRDAEHFISFPQQV